MTIAETLMSTADKMERLSIEQGYLMAMKDMAEILITSNTDVTLVDLQMKMQVELDRRKENKFKS